MFLINNITKKYYTKSVKNKNNIKACSKMKEDVAILMTNNYNIAVNFEYCLLGHQYCRKNQYCKLNRIVIMYLINNLPSYLKTESKQE